jgi:hypothetical protein
MPQVGKMKFPYTPEGKKAAKVAKTMPAQKLLGKTAGKMAKTMPATPLVKKSKMTQGQAMAKGIERAMDKFRK